MSTKRSRMSTHTKGTMSMKEIDYRLIRGMGLKRGGMSRHTEAMSSKSIFRSMLRRHTKVMYIIGKR